MGKRWDTVKERWEAVKLAVKWTYRSSRKLTIAILSITVILGLFTLIGPYVFKLLIDKLALGATAAAQMTMAILGLVLISGAAVVIETIMWEVQFTLKRLHSQRMEIYATRKMMEKISSLDMSYFENAEYYNTLTKAERGLGRMNDVFWQATFLLNQLVSTIAIVIAIIVFDPRIVALIVAASIPGIIFVFKTSEVYWSAFSSSSPIYKHARYYRNLMINTPQATKELKLFGLKGHFLERFESLFENYMGRQRRAATKEAWLDLASGIISGGLTIIAAWIAIKLFLNGEITIGSLTFLWALVFQFSGKTRAVTSTIGEVNENAAFVSPLVKILGMESKIKEIKEPFEFPEKLKMGIEFRDVTFIYPEAKEPALKNFNLKIEAGESLALVGENGSGKTTLIKLLTRLYDVTEGEILIDGINIKNYSIESLHRNIGVIFQDFMKYEALVKENIGYGDVEKLKEEGDIHEASRKSEAWDFIKEMDKQYKTPLGRTISEKGTELSVGQWQKIALARAFFKDAPILCLDEPTAAVDARAEYRLFRKFEQLTKEKTTILISHRFSTVKMAHKIAVIEKGRLREYGSHRELLRKNGIYAELFRMQAESYRE